jgi:asparagine synthase (glutamine-hydrolysing)
MCGICGFIDTSARPREELAALATRMANRLAHRGPDDSGVWVDTLAGVALAHRRLAVLDLSPQGHQPMRSSCGRYSLVFNGEIYNFRELRRDLQRVGVQFRGHSDTEVLLAAIGKWGLDSAIVRLNGMFAFAVWDGRNGELHLVRDRMGEKPLYYGWAGRTFLFASEVKALRVHPDFDSEIDCAALGLYFSHNYIPGPHSIYQKVRKLTPAGIVTVRLDESSLPEPRIYWSARKKAESGARAPFTGTMSAAADQLEDLLADAVQLRMESDVPLGAFLSGGIDSSLVVALMQRQNGTPPRTYTIGFTENRYNEAPYAKAISRHLNTVHKELYVTPAEAMACIPLMPSLYSEPFADVSQIPTFLVSKLARSEVTVTLSGDGGDELFVGYTRYFRARNIWRTIRLVPQPFRRLSAQLLGAFAPPLSRMRRIALILRKDTRDEIYRELVGRRDLKELLLNPSERPEAAEVSQIADLLDFERQMAYFDSVTYLPDDILVKLDRASMGVSLESRVPLLDHRVVEFAWSLPAQLTVQGNQGKRVLREVLYRYVPRELVDRPKTGFGVPIGDWLCGPLREWAEDLLNQRNIFFDSSLVRRKWEEHLSGRVKDEAAIWGVLMFQAWLQQETALAHAA